MFVTPTERRRYSATLLRSILVRRKYSLAPGGASDESIE
jgi:hypothetical protein